MTRAAGTSRIAHLERRRREMAAAYVKATRRHAPRAALAQKLVRATCDALQAEIRDARAAAKASAPSGTPDLFAAPEQDGASERAAA
ncbi:hypothetical protein [Xanthobacter aminoxidans]|uniref:hypothetical protein n=1 Tax=Xanthobacter aminoxidans TaxID=186280 RepID=UPI002022E5A9|nr:hypothetical protein [Xanthobacter aminoxidans]MCL8385818.1 hypothetical protein [Xanthobacter aminoxidans]